ncbi:MAG: flagellar motor protein MotB [Flavobacterium sp. BFFFF1]|uniref:OmpA family protein n=1 Tax=Flavobacterium sp. BFFFF1 TaxID=2015557 RepID=UPI000BD9DE76|nr:OmpA family protein [Flavobacterium sp. BFFFF1]OYU82160.1 MAG: flagellar motor protein MotB [Flavobacterium sp. BFFFF1]
MQKIKTLALILVLLSASSSFAQDFQEIRARRLFERTYYSDAIPLYEDIAKENRSMEVLRNLADCYYYTNDPENALKWYQLLLNIFRNMDEEYYFRYEQVLKATGDYEEANKIMRSRLVSKKDNEKLEQFDRDVIRLENISGIGERFDIVSLPVNTENSEFGAVSLGDKIVFAGIAAQTASGKKYKWNDERYLDLLTIPSDDFASANNFSAELNTDMHEADVIFTKDGKTAYFTRNNFKNGKRARNGKKVSVMQIFRAELLEGKWTNITSLPFNNENYSVEHPALSPDEQTLYFASDMPGTLGSFDIFSVLIVGNKYGIPENLGEKINTDKKEQFPFVSKDGKLYFSSNGHFGYGLMDVFVSEFKNGEFAEPLNVGLPVNSGYDDFAFNIDSDTKRGFFASDRPGGKGGDDIYTLLETKPLLIRDCMQLIAGIISDIDSKLPLEKATVVLQDASKTEIGKLLTDAEGKFSFDVNCERNYTVLASKTGYSSDSRLLSLGKIRGKSNDASMELKSEAVAKKELELQLEKDKMDQAEKLAQQKEKDRQLAVTRKKEKEQALLDKEKDVVRDKDRLLIKTEPIYFDYDLWYIRKESKPILNRVIELMKRYPDMVVEIGSHTDVRGNNAYNLNLSSKRAASTRDYFLKMGIPASRIYSKGYGETMPIIQCVPDHSCSEEQHELNRRSEFVIKNL